MAQKNEQKENNSPKIDYRFLTGLVLIIFLVLINSYVKDIPWFIVAIPAMLMGLDMTSIIDAVKGTKKK